MDLALFIAGIALIVLTLVDFLYTTLSCNGSGRLSTTVNRALDRVLTSGSQVLRNWSGIIHLLFTLATWVVLLLTGGLLIVSAYPEMVVLPPSGKIADLSERFYFLAFTFSTLGMGDYTPGTEMGRYFTAVYSLLGFGVLTTAITYILSVTGAATKKKTLATFISTMGEHPADLFDYFTTKEDGSFFSDRIDDLVEQINMHVNDHLSYPIVHYFHSDERPWSAIIQLASLQECVLALRVHYAERKDILAHLRRLERTINRYLELARVPEYRLESIDTMLLTRRKGWYDQILKSPTCEDKPTENCRAFGVLLDEAGHSWDTVFDA